MNNEVTKVLREIVAVLGPTVPASVRSQGARFEWEHALKLANHGLEVLANERGNGAGDVVVTRDGAGRIVSVTRQDRDGHVLALIAEAEPDKIAADIERDAARWRHVRRSSNLYGLRLTQWIDDLAGPGYPMPNLADELADAELAGHKPTKERP